MWADRNILLAMDVLDAIERLIDQSLVRVDEHGGTAVTNCSKPSDSTPAVYSPMSPNETPAPKPTPPTRCPQRSKLAALATPLAGTSS